MADKHSIFTIALLVIMFFSSSANAASLEGACDKMVTNIATLGPTTTLTKEEFMSIVEVSSEIATPLLLAHTSMLPGVVLQNDHWTDNTKATDTGKERIAVSFDKNTKTVKFWASDKATSAYNLDSVVTKNSEVKTAFKGITSALKGAMAALHDKFAGFLKDPKVITDPPEIVKGVLPFTMKGSECEITAAKAKQGIEHTSGDHTVELSIKCEPITTSTSSTAPPSSSSASSTASVITDPTTKEGSGTTMAPTKATQSSTNKSSDSVAMTSTTLSSTCVVVFATLFFMLASIS